MRLIEVIGISSIVVGWFATHMFSEARERRKELRSQLDKLLEMLVSLENEALSFHLAKEFNAATARDLTGQIDRIERVIGRFPLADEKEIGALLVQHRRSITLHNFDSSSFATQLVGSDLLADVTDASRDLEDYLEERYGANYPSRFPYFEPSPAAVVGVLILVLLAACTIIALQVADVI